MCSILILTTVAGCATYRPVIDTKGINLDEYENDLKACQDFAKQVDPAGEMAAGAAGGALLGALMGAAVGGRGMSGYGARVGAANGMGAGAAAGLAGQIQIVRNCIAGRGYRVLR
jgi:outer membrane lipoprotein SlyB